MIRVEKTHLPVAALTHPGMKGKNNEDRFGVSAFRMKGPAGIPVLLAVLSDGIGGHRAGEVASEMAVNIISKHVADSDGVQPARILEEAIIRASDVIHQQAEENLEQQGMGATCACVWIAGDRLFTATVGDSRIYLMRSGDIRQISIDHTWIQEALERGLLQPDEVEGHPNAHVIRRYLGSPTPPEVDFRIQNGDREQGTQGMQLLPGDRLLLCSDGLTDLVDDKEILTAFQQDTLDAAGQQLINLANERGGHDNITIVVVEVPDPHSKPVAAAAAAPVVPRGRSLLAGCMGVTALAIVAGVMASGWLLYSGAGRATPTPTPAVQYSPTPAVTRTRQATTASRTLTPLTPDETPTPLMGQATPTPAVPASAPGGFPTLTPWRVTGSTPTSPLPVVTVSR